MWVCVKQNEGKRFPLEKISTLRMDDFWGVGQLVGSSFGKKRWWVFLMRHRK
jgi:hypothetical protein